MRFSIKIEGQVTYGDIIGTLSLVLAVLSLLF